MYIGCVTATDNKCHKWYRRGSQLITYCFLKYVPAQLLDTGVLHNDPHEGNLLKVRRKNGEVELGYLDFGLVNEVPQGFRDGIVCAVVQIVFARNIEAVADLCVGVGLLPEKTLQDLDERKKLLDAVRYAFDNILAWPIDKRGRATGIPKVRFQNLLACLAIITAKFDFTVPPYFLNSKCLHTCNRACL